MPDRCTGDEGGERFGHDPGGCRRELAHHDLHGFGTFEEVPPGLEEMAARMVAVQSKDLPYLVAEAHGRVLGFGYAGPFRQDRVRIRRRPHNRRVYCA